MDGLPEQIQYLSDESPIVRYWAAVGLHAMGVAELLPLTDPLMKRLKEKGSPLKNTLVTSSMDM